jgi:thioredoxin-like negative regulator of GroEL
MSTSPEQTCTSICPSPRQGNRTQSIAQRIRRATARRQPPPSLVAADNESFGAAVSDELPVLVELTAPRCRPCRPLDLTVEQAASDFAGRLKVVTVNIDEAPAIVQRLGVHVVPTLILLHHGTEVGRREGALPAAALNHWLDHSLRGAA